MICRFRERGFGVKWVGDWRVGDNLVIICSSKKRHARLFIIIFFRGDEGGGGAVVVISLWVSTRVFIPCTSIFFTITVYLFM